MKQRGNIKIFLLVVILLIIVALIVLFWLNDLNFKDLVSKPTDQELSLFSSEDIAKRDAKLFFGIEGNLWQIETREIMIPSLQLEERVRVIIEVLLGGPEVFKSTSIPKGTQLNRIYLDEDGIAYLDLSEELKEKHLSGTWGELVTIYSLVNTVMENFHTIKGVKILIRGKEIETLKGHIDTRYPFTFRDQL